MEKDIFDIFKEQQHNLDEMPSSSVWQRLEKKLDNKPQRNRGIIRFFSMSVAAAIFIVVFMGSLAAIIIMRVNKENNALVATQNPDGTNLSTDSAIVFDSNEITGQDAKPGNDQTATDHIIASAETKIPGKIGADYVEKESGSRNDVSIPEDLATTQDDIVATEAVTSLPSEDNLAEVKESRKAATNAKAENDDAHMAKAKMAKPGASSAPMAAESSKKMTADAAQSGQSPEIILRQLEGKWLGTNNGTTNIEEWKQLDDKNWSGKGYTIANGDTTFTETMNISNIGGKTYYTGNFDPFGGSVRIPISHYDNNKIIFEDDSEQGFPNQVTIEIKEGQLTTTIQNNTATPPSSSQNEYLSKRNAVKQNKAVRKLKKIKK